MAKILLDYVFPIAVVATVPAASTAFLKQVCVVAKPKAGQESNVGTIYTCTTMTQVAARTDNTNAQQLFDAGMTKVYVLLADDLDLATFLETGGDQFWTILISDDFGDDDIAGEGGAVAAVKATIKIQDITYEADTAGTGGNSIRVRYLDTNTGGAASASASGNDISVSIEAGVTTAAAIKAAIEESVACAALVNATVDSGDESDPQAAVGYTSLAGGVAAVAGDIIEVGDFDGVVAVSSSDQSVASGFGAAENRCAFFTDDTNKAKNMFYAFGKFLSNLLNWSDQQYITMPFNDGVETLGDANSLFDDRVCFVINDDEFGNRLALFVAGGKAIAAPYIGKNLRLDMQSRTLSWIAANQPKYTLVNAALLEQRLQEDVINLYVIDRQWIEAGTINVALLEDNFVASGEIDIAEPKALWRMFGEMRSTL